VWPHRLRLAQPGAGAPPYTYVTTKEFLLEFGLATLRHLPDFEALKNAGLLRDKLLAGAIASGFEDITVVAPASRTTNR
jgi:hypothetical protein